MYVCVCNGVTDNEIRQAAAAGCSGLTELTMRTGCGACCGSCVEVAAALLADETRRIAEARQAAIVPLPMVAAAA